jgi:hypothetical protein
MCNRHRRCTWSDVHYEAGYKREGGQGINIQSVIIPSILLHRVTHIPCLLDVERGAAGQSDMRMNSSDVSAAVSLPRPGKERIQTAGSSEEKK